MDGITNGNHPPNMAKLYYQREKEFENTLKEREVGGGGGVPKTATPKQTKRTITAVTNILVSKQDSDSAPRTAKKKNQKNLSQQEMSPKGRREANFSVFQVSFFCVCVGFFLCSFVFFFFSRNATGQAEIVHQQMAHAVSNYNKSSRTP